MSGEVDPTLARLKRLPPRLRVAHLAALLRHERQAITPALSYSSSHERQRVVGRDGANALGDAKRRPESVRVGVGERPPTLASASLRPSRERAMLASDPTAARGEGSDLSNGSRRDGRGE
jgi:hypothetical protein